MDKPFKFLLPSPSFEKKPKGGNKAKSHFLTPSGMTLLPREKQPPPMYGKMGATIPARYLNPVATENHIPESVKQYCEPCEVELQSVDDYKRHRAQHEKCPVAGCQYQGHPTVMDKHITSLHSSGLFEKFKKLSSPEEIATWREERRKRFPTVANVLLKQKAQEQRQKRGERLEATRNRFGKKEDRKRAQPNAEDEKTALDNNTNGNKSNNKNLRNKKRNNKNRKARRDRKDDKPIKDSSVEQAKASAKETEDDSWHGLTAFCGTFQMESYKHTNTKLKTRTQNALFGLVGMYGSDDESEDDQDVEENGDGIEDMKETCRHDNKVHFNAIVIENIVDIQQEDGTIHDTVQKITSEEENNYKVYPNNDCKGIIASHKQSHISKKAVKFPTEITKGNGTLEATAATPCILGKDTNAQIFNGNSSDEAPEETPIQRSIPEYQINREKSKISIPSPSNNTLEHAAKQHSQEKSKAKPILKRKSGLDYRKLKMRKQNTMLEKLLESDIRHERNVLLQCVRYVCENNFFEIASKPSVG